MANWSTLAAWWGAGTGTAALLFEVYKYAKSGPQLHLRVAADFETTVASGTRAGKSFVHVSTDVGLRVVNRGNEPTTVREVAVVHYRSAWHRLLKRPSSPLKSYSYSSEEGLPKVLDAGHEWLASIPQRRLLDDYGEQGHLLVGVLCSHAEQPTLMRVRVSAASAGTIKRGPH